MKVAVSCCRVAIVAAALCATLQASATADPIGDAPVRIGSKPADRAAATPSPPAATSAKPAAASGATSTPAPAATPATPPSPFEIASRKYQGGQQAEALTEFQALAEQGDARAQYLVALDLIEGKYVPRNVAQGFAWLLLASEDKQFGDFVAAKAREARAVVEPQVSGADLIHADQLVGQYRARHPSR
jgi:TPR repeat protein